MEYYYGFLALIFITWGLIIFAIYNYIRVGKTIVKSSNIKVSGAAWSWTALAILFLILIILNINESVQDSQYWIPILFLNLSIYNIISWWKVRIGEKGIVYRGRLYTWKEIKGVNHYDDTVKVNVEKKKFLLIDSFNFKVKGNLFEILSTLRIKLKDEK